MRLNWDDEHTRDWVVRDALLAAFPSEGAYDFSPDMLGDRYFIGVMLRRWAADNPDAVSLWRPLASWRRIIGWQRQPTDPAPSQRFGHALEAFFTAGQNRIGSENPWGIACRSEMVRKSNVSYAIAEYSIGRILPVTWRRWITLRPPPPPPPPRPVITQEQWERDWAIAEEKRCKDWYEEEVDLWACYCRDTKPSMPPPRPAPPMPSNAGQTEPQLRARAPFTEPMTEAEALAIAIDTFHQTGEPIKAPPGITE
jgi:hypothetical protein